MSYNGNKPKENRKSNEWTEEAYSTIRLGNEMQETLHEFYQRNLINLCKVEMRIGIHTGNIVGGLIGKNHVRYDIFGADVFAAYRIMTEGPPGVIRVSESTHDLIKVN